MAACLTRKLMVQSLQLIEVLSWFGSVGGESERETEATQILLLQEWTKSSRKFVEI